MMVVSFCPSVRNTQWGTWHYTHAGIDRTSRAVERLFQGDFQPALAPEAECIVGACPYRRNQMNPRPSSQSPEGDSRRFSPALALSMGSIRARVVHVFAQALALR